jgi:hypothetical protein
MSRPVLLSYSCLYYISALRKAAQTMSFTHLLAANESTGARGEVIVDITHSLVVERSYFILVSSNVEASFAASCLYHGDLLVNSPILYSTFLSHSC